MSLNDQDDKDDLDPRNPDWDPAWEGDVNEPPAARPEEMTHPQFRSAGGEQRCRKCGCTRAVPCPGGCFWIEPNLCTNCADPEYLAYLNAPNPKRKSSPIPVQVDTRPRITQADIDLLLKHKGRFIQ
jgi:hypothetical protein